MRSFKHVCGEGGYVRPRGPAAFASYFHAALPPLQCICLSDVSFSATISATIVFLVVSRVSSLS